MPNAGRCGSRYISNVAVQLVRDVAPWAAGEPEPLVSDAGGCVSPAWIDLSRQESEGLDSGLRRRYELAASLGFEPSLVRIDEEILVQEIDPSKRAAPPRLLRRAHADRIVTVSDGKMVANAPSLWMKVINASE